ncbi:MAG: hypothetical protein JWR24_904 [Actinoallomurus sp.]|nr:hypothetical protein [Actinoallomurus sp.]
MRRFIYPHAFRMVSSVTAGLLIAGALIGVGTTPALAADGSVLHKSAQNVTHQGADSADHVDVIN